MTPKEPFYAADVNVMWDSCRSRESYDSSKMALFPPGVWRFMCDHMPAHSVLRLVCVNRKLASMERLPLNWCHNEEYKIGDYANTQKTIQRATELKRFNWMGLRVLECDDADLRKMMSAFPQLHSLESAFANMSGLEGLQPVRATLRKLVLKNAGKLKKTTALQGFNKLKMLAISWCADLDQVDLSDAACPALREVSLYQCSSLRTIQALPRTLRILTVGCPAALTDISAVGTCVNLEEVAFTWCENLSTVKELRKCSKLRKCDLNHCSALCDVRPLSNLRELVDLNLSHCKLISDISALSSCISLADLKLVGCPKIQDLSCLSSCKLLGKLDISFCMNVRGTAFLGQIGQIIQAR